MNNFHNSGAYASFFYANFHHKSRRPMESHRAALFIFGHEQQGGEAPSAFPYLYLFLILFLLLYLFGGV